MDLIAASAKKRERKDELERLLADPATFSDTRKLKDLNREYDDIKATIDLADRYEALLAGKTEAEKTIAGSADEPEMLELAKEELAVLVAQEESLRTELESALVPPE